MADCLTCKFSVVDREIGNHHHLECHYGPPACINTRDGYAHWPRVKEYDRCGKWEKREENLEKQSSSGSSSLQSSSSF